MRGDTFRRFGRVALAALPLLAAGGCGGKKYTCTIYAMLGGQKVLVGQVPVKSRAECQRLVEESGAKL